MLIGSFSHTLDAKGRVFVPAKWRDDVGDLLIVTLGLLGDGSTTCLFGMSVSEWELFSEKLAALPVTDVAGQAVRRRLYAMAAACETDKQGRVLVPQMLRDYANLGSDVVVIGVGTRAELWNKDTWESYLAEKEEGYSDIADDVLPEVEF